MHLPHHDSLPSSLRISALTGSRSTSAKSTTEVLHQRMFGAVADRTTVQAEINLGKRSAKAAWEGGIRSRPALQTILAQERLKV